MKKTIIAVVFCVLVLSGCGTEASKPSQIVEHEPEVYVLYGRYELQGQVITADGNVWEYSQDTISEKPSYNNEPVLAVFSDNGTPGDIYDDYILGLVLDVETAIYDALKSEYHTQGPLCLLMGRALLWAI